MSVPKTVYRASRHMLDLFIPIFLHVRLGKVSLLQKTEPHHMARIRAHGTDFT